MSKSSSVRVFPPPMGKQAARHGEQGFTLVEMLVVIAIIGLIMGLIGPRVLNYLGESDGSDAAELLRECARLAVLPQALAAIDLALWDLAGRRGGEPVWRLLGAPGPVAVEVNHTVAAADRAWL